MTTPISADLPLRDERFDWAGWLGRLGSLMGLIFVFLLFAVLVQVVPDSASLATLDNLVTMVRHTAVVGTAAIGMTLVIVSGGIDLSAGSVMALSTVFLAQLLKRDVPAAAAVLGGIGAGAACGLIIGVLITRLKLSPFIVTLGMWGSVRGAAKGFAGQATVDPPINWNVRTPWLSGLLTRVPSHRWWTLVPPGVWLMLTLAVAVALMLRYTRAGRHIFAIGSNEQTARLCGVPVERTKLLIYLLGASFAGLAGVLEFSRLGVGDATTRTGAELDVIAAVVIGGASLTGGQGSVFGSLVGALLMTMVANGCTKLGLKNWVQEIATGAIIIFAVALDRLRHRRAV